ncbi:hypothetical protein AB9R84_15375 [Oceanimonas smirnovii]|uniref:hypothetical protein n=1 Tax=Oceanimonas smirnovii TaxID=264574 RepID=UPI003AAD13D5
MTYDEQFDQTRLDQLARQYLTKNSIKGKVVFFSDADDNQLDCATWQFEESDYQTLKESGFRLHLMELLNTLLVYRAQHQRPNASQGVVHLRGNQLSVEWLSREQVDTLRQS